LKKNELPHGLSKLPSHSPACGPKSCHNQGFVLTSIHK